MTWLTHAFTLAAVLTTAHAAAQVTATAKLQADLTAEVSRSSLAGTVIDDVDTLPSSTDVSAGAAASATSSWSQASTTFTPIAVTWRHVEFRIDGVAHVAQGSTASGGTVHAGLTGDFDVLLRIETPTQLFGEVVVREEFALVSTRIDIGDDGSDEYAFDPFTTYPNPRTESFPAVADTAANPLLVRVRGNIASIFPFESVLTQDRAGSITIRFVPDLACSAAPYGTSCASGLTMEPRTSPNGDLVLRAFGAGSDPAAAMLGFSPASVPVPFPPFCDLQTGVAVVVYFGQVAGANIATIPYMASGLLTFNAQAAALDLSGGTVRLSEPVTLGCFGP